MNYQTEFRVQQLRTKNIAKALESISAFVAAVVANMIIPQLLLRYVYDPTTLITPPPVFEYLPLVTYGASLLYFIVVFASNIAREREARRLEENIFSMSDACCNDGECQHDNDQITDEELAELEKIVDEALKTTKKTKKKTTKKSTAKKTTKRKSK